MTKRAFTIGEIGEIVSGNYEIGNIKEIDIILEGTSSECFHIITEEKEYLFKDIEMIFMNHPDKEPLINCILLKNGIPVSEFYKTKNDKYLLEYLGHTFHLQSFISGEILKVNTAPEWFMKESAEVLGKIHKGLEEIPILSSGIGKEFFSFVTPEVAKISYEKSLERAIEYGEKQNIIDLNYRIELLDKIKNIKLDIDRFTYKNTHGDYFSQYYESNNSNKQVLCNYAHWSTMLCRWFEENIDELTSKLERIAYKTV